MSVTFQDYYKTLEVPRTATQADITKAYRRLARKFHPDLNKSKEAEDQFKRINEANEVLSDPKKRARYDELGADWKAGQDFKPPPGWEDLFAQFSQPHRRGTERGQRRPERGKASFQFGGSGFSDFFDMLFGGSEGGNPFGGAAGAARRRPTFAEEPKTRHVSLTISVEDAYRGASKVITVPQTELNAEGLAEFKTKQYRIKIPPGTTDGKVIRLTRKGDDAAGELILTVKVAPHPQFRLEGEHIVATALIAPWEAALGAKVTVPTVNGSVSISIPAGSQSGQRLRLRSKGMPLKQGGHGDMFVEIKIVVPKNLSEKERALFTELASVSKFRPRDKN